MHLPSFAAHLPFTLALDWRRWWPLLPRGPLPEATPR